MYTHYDNRLGTIKYAKQVYNNHYNLFLLYKVLFDL